jgi:hypothetical protein
MENVNYTKVVFCEVSTWDSILLFPAALLLRIRCFFLNREEFHLEYQRGVGPDLLSGSLGP